ncbi:hypothetical protein THARTR1_05166 [Trichoderma harzianum]|uniref:Uncharacterized protein n=1 Tax=Trichoderma harzianum TaxID=5544 RepID=A0A2K0U9Z6_TRIHA|nr:hypothetical protein THARTR1_05166 [Trichoderma harzianum]
MVTQPAKIPVAAPGPLARAFPAVIAVGVGKSFTNTSTSTLPSDQSTNNPTPVSAVALNVRSQLKTHSAQQDRFFAQYKSPESEAVRQKVFDGAVEDPRKSWFNVLGW